MKNNVISLTKKVNRKNIVCMVATLLLFWGGDSALRRASFTYASFRSRDLSDSTWWREDLSKYNVRGYTLQGASFPESDLIGVDLRGSNLTKARFRGADLTRADLRGAILRKADLTACILSFAKLQNADLSGAKLEQAVLAGADLSNARLTSANLNHCRYDSMTKWPPGFDPKQHGATLLTFPWPTKLEPRRWGATKGIFDR